MRPPTPGPTRTGVWGLLAAGLGTPAPPPRAAGVGGGAGADVVAGDDSCTRAPGYAWGRGARACAACVGGFSRVRPARERACGCAYPVADWPARVVRVRARCQARTVGSRSAWCLWGSCAQTADVLDWPAGGGGGAAQLGNCGRQAGRRAGWGAWPLPVPSPSLPSLRPGGAPSGLCPGRRARLPRCACYLGEIHTMTGRKISAFRPRK